MENKQWEHEVYLCSGFADLEQIIRSCGREGYQLVSVVQTHDNKWAAFLKRKVS